MPARLRSRGTGSFAAWQTVSIPVTLQAGSHTVKLAFPATARTSTGSRSAKGADDDCTQDNDDADAVAAGPRSPPCPTTAAHGSAVKFTVTPASGKSIGSAWWSFDAPAHLNTWNSRAISPTFFYPSAGTFSPLVKLTYTDGSTETVERTGYIRAA